MSLPAATPADAAPASRWSIALHRTTTPQPIPAADALGFGTTFTDHVFRVGYTPAGGWASPRIEPHAAFALSPAAPALHYAQSVFEGLKAHRGADGRVRLFRLRDHCARFERSARLLSMPAVPAGELAEAIRQLVALEAAWTPAAPGTALYVRPLLYGTDAALGVRPSGAYECAVILSPVGSYYGGDTLRPVSLWVERERVRAAPGGIGAVKAAANYAAALTPAVEARARGYDQVLWLDARERRFLEEVGTMNVFVRLGDTVVTPPLGGTILAGITRDSVLALLRDWGHAVEERPIALDEVLAALQAGGEVELFGTGTAAVISAVGRLGLADGDVAVGDGHPGALTRRLFDALTALHRGEADDTRGWLEVVAEAG